MQVLSQFPEQPEREPAARPAASVAEALRPQLRPVPVPVYTGAVIRRGEWNDLTGGDGGE